MHPLVAVFEQLDTDGTGLIGRLAMLERLRSDRELRARMQLSIHNLDDERAAFERVFHSMAGAAFGVSSIILSFVHILFVRTVKAI